MVDLRSDTVTKPDEEMRRAPLEASVGDDVYQEDKTVNELEKKAADLVSKEAGLFVPSGTMGNQIAARVHTNRGQEVLCDVRSHIYKWELGGLAQLSELQVRTIDCDDRAVPTATQVREGYIEEDLHRAGTGLLTLENTHNHRGGVAVPKAHIDEAVEAAHNLGVPVHMDGARLFNAATAQDTDAAALVENVDSVMFCLSKGLGAPVGSLLCGPTDFIEQARRTRKLLGGGMRQAGMIAAPGLVALENISRLDEDHENATHLSKGINKIPGLSSPLPDSNIVIVDSSDLDMLATEFVQACKEEDIYCIARDEYTTRFCTHLDISKRDIDTAVERIRSVAEAS